MPKPLNGLAAINIELTSRCNKNCWMCGRRRIESEHPQLAMDYGDMEFTLLERIAEQLPQNIIVQLHNNGEPTLYPRLGDAIKLFSRQISGFDTNGKLLLEKADEIIGSLDTMAVSIIEGDPEADEQYEILQEFLNLKKSEKPHVVLRLNGEITDEKYTKLNLVTARRILHSPMGSFNYQRGKPTIPEIGICLDFLHHPAIDRKGYMSICVRFDPKRLGVIGNAAEEQLADIWNGDKRMAWMRLHKTGCRTKVPLCSHCDYWGVPTGNIQSDPECRDPGNSIDQNKKPR